ncbi:hypothetical protein AB7783_07195 [Tardiphaga sp. 172_B4_N1_3]|uniref:hypothetical protein n=1 Tax=Tardiphaga sp. 172_B4_N1_3 TaxID=3240787 RepID=UPI003F8C0AEC
MTPWKARRSHDFEAQQDADRALDAARAMPPGLQRTEALKRAGRLRNAAMTGRLMLERSGIDGQTKEASDVGS